ncbi:MAG: hypothetical protein Crog2KO_31490 [Crocinitomicaceae bacterium]
MLIRVVILLLLGVTFGVNNTVQAQDTIIIDSSGGNLNRSIADAFTLYSSDNHLSYSEFISEKQKGNLDVQELKLSVENIDFTTRYYYIHFVLENKTKTTKRLYLETARPITNLVQLIHYDESSNQILKQRKSGDNIPFKEKDVLSTRSILNLSVDAHSSATYLLVLGSDGEVISLPMILWEKPYFEISERQTQFYSGIFYGIFIFVIIIYFTFFILLKDRLFLLYILYVAFSGLLQFALDGYVHQFFFTNGGYFTDHSIILIAGNTVFFALSYAMKYLQLEGRKKQISQVFLALVAVTTLISLIPGPIYAFCYPLINIFSLVSLAYLLVLAMIVRRKRNDISAFFLIGLFSLFMGAIVFILGNVGVIDAPLITQNSLKVGALAEIICLFILMAGKYKSLQEEKEAAQRQLFIELEEKNRLTEKANVRLELEVQERTKEIQRKSNELAEKNRDLMDSINYAERIQSALLPPPQKIKTWLTDFFIYFQPKDVLSGDFYWIEEVQTTEEVPQDLLLYATADCTGHGVPGAFVSVVCNNLLKLSKIQSEINSPGEALDFVNREINTVLNPAFQEQEIRDGMDIALCAINFNTMKLYYAGAKIPLYLLRDGEIIVYKGDRHAIGNDTKKADFRFNTETIELQSGDRLYTFSDGIPDQFGGPDDKKFLTKRLKALLLEHANLSMQDQKEKVTLAMEEWMQGKVQIDDMLLIGVQIP